jgi:response regulator of citrate/malate metabolism
MPMAMTNYDVIFIDDEPTMVDIFNHFTAWKFKHWRCCSFTDSQDLYDRIVTNQISASVWIVDIMMPRKNGTQIAAAIAQECEPGTVILGYTALDQHTLDSRPEYAQGVKHFSRIFNKQDNFNALLELVDLWVKGDQRAIGRNI